ncbi:hypothetical protein FHS35_008771 [Streptomyces umbrinus]|nr:hypothetical protein [Streptomyces umbrinus]
MTEGQVWVSTGHHPRRSSGSGPGKQLIQSRADLGLANVGVLRAESAVFGPVASDPTSPASLMSSPQPGRRPRRRLAPHRPMSASRSGTWPDKRDRRPADRRSSTSTGSSCQPTPIGRMQPDLEEDVRTPPADVLRRPRPRRQRGAGRRTIRTGQAAAASARCECSLLVVRLASSGSTPSASDWRRRGPRTPWVAAATVCSGSPTWRRDEAVGTLPGGGEHRNNRDLGTRLSAWLRRPPASHVGSVEPLTVNPCCAPQGFPGASVP